MIAFVVALAAAPAVATGASAAPLRTAADAPCLAREAEAGDAQAWIALGAIEQIRGDRDGSFGRYLRAYQLGADPATTPFSITLVGDVLWVQTDRCPLPVPTIPLASLLAKPSTAPPPDTAYPTTLRTVRAEGNATLRVWIDADGKVARAVVADASSGPPGLVRRRVPGEESAERQFARIQFALASLDAVRVHPFGGGVEQVWEGRLAYRPPNDLLENLPGHGFDSSALPVSRQ